MSKLKHFSDFELALLYDSVQSFMELGHFENPDYRNQTAHLWADLKAELDSREEAGLDTQEIFDDFNT